MSPIFKFKKLCVCIFSIQIFLIGAISITITQFIAKAIFRGKLAKKQEWLNNTKKRFILLLLTIFQLAAPSKIRVTSENSSIAPNTLSVNPKTKRIHSNLAKTSVMIANHQIYTDWVFLWWFAYTANLAGNVIIMLKKSLESIPILGYGMKNYNFIFMSRKWALDKTNLHNQLSELNADALGSGRISGNHPENVSLDGALNWGDRVTDNQYSIHWPYSLILFPEGTNLSANTRNKSQAFAEKIDIEPFKHVLVPHTTGLREILQHLRQSCAVVYDTCIGYSGVTPDNYGQDIYTLKDLFLKGKQPKLIDIHIRSFNVSDIPIDDELEFQNWLFKVWREKDNYMDYYYKYGNFNMTNDTTSVEAACSVSIWEYITILFLPIAIILLVFSMILKKIF